MGGVKCKVRRVKGNGTAGSEESCWSRMVDDLWELFGGGSTVI